MGTESILDARISFVWTEVHPELLDDTIPYDATYGFIGNQRGYTKRFDALQEGAVGKSPVDPVLRLPWHTPPGLDFFWRYYLEGKDPAGVDGDSAWKQLIPIRRAIPGAIAMKPAENLPVTVRGSISGFLYQFGFALVVDFFCSAGPSITPEQLSRLAFRLREDDLTIAREKKNTSAITNEEGEKPRATRLNNVALDGLARLRADVLGEEAPVGSYSVKPFSIVTVIRGQGVDPAVPVVSGGEVHRMLQAVTAWNPNYRTATLPPLDEHRIVIRKEASPGDIVYANERGRAVWFPGMFADMSRKRRSLSCYHRNLTMLSMHVEVLSCFVGRTADLIRHPGDSEWLLLAHRSRARRAAGILGRLQGAEESTFRSGSTPVQIRENDWADNLIRLRTELGM